MEPIVVAALSCGVMLGGVVLGASLHHRLAGHHLDDNCRDIVRLGAGLLGTIVAVSMGLLINSSVVAFEAERRELRRMTADIMLLDHTLEVYGPGAQPIRVLLRNGVQQIVDHMWSSSTTPPDLSEQSLSAAIYRSLQALPELAPGHPAARAQAINLAMDIARARLMLFAASRTPMPLVVVGVLVFWLTVLFLSFSLFNPVNRASQAALAVIAVSASVALFVFMEMSYPFSGIVNIPTRALAEVLPPLS